MNFGAGFASAVGGVIGLYAGALVGKAAGGGPGELVACGIGGTALGAFVGAVVVAPNEPVTATGVAGPPKGVGSCDECDRAGRLLAITPQVDATRPASVPAQTLGAPPQVTHAKTESGKIESGKTESGKTESGKKKEDMKIVGIGQPQEAPRNFAKPDGGLAGAARHMMGQAEPQTAAGVGASYGKVVATSTVPNAAGIQAAAQQGNRAGTAAGMETARHYAPAPPTLTAAPQLIPGHPVSGSGQTQYQVAWTASWYAAYRAAFIASYNHTRTVMINSSTRRAQPGVRMLAGPPRGPQLNSQLG